MTKAELALEVRRLRTYEWFAGEVEGMLGEKSLPDRPPPEECLHGVLGELRARFADVAKAKAQRDLVIRRLHHVVEVLDSLDVQLGQAGVSKVVRVFG